MKDKFYAVFYSKEGFGRIAVFSLKSKSEEFLKYITENCCVPDEQFYDSANFEGTIGIDVFNTPLPMYYEDIELVYINFLSV